MNSDSDPDSGDLTSRWPDLPPDMLLAIATRLDPTVGILRLRSVCRSWRSLLSLSSTPHFPLNLPSVVSLSSYFLSPPPPSTNLRLLRRTVCLLSPPDDRCQGFLVKVEEIGPNTFSLFNPLSKDKLRKPTSPINLLDYRATAICCSYVAEEVNSRASSSDSAPQAGKTLIKKVVAARDFFKEGDFVVLALTDAGKLLLWRVGDEGWTGIGPSTRRFDDVISYKGKFYATADKRGRLLMIDSRLKPMDLVHSLMYGVGKCTHLLECDGGLYLIDRIQGYKKLELGVFKLDDKCRFWDYELSLNSNTYFVGNDVNFSVLRRDYYGDVRNCIYFMTNIREGNEGRDITAVLDTDKGTIHPVYGSDLFGSIYWPPSSWFR